MSPLEDAIKTARDMQKWHREEWARYLSVNSLYAIFNAAVDSINLRKENAELRASLEHLEKLASARVDEAAKTTKIESMEDADGSEEGV